MIFATASVFAACNSKTDTDLDTKKDVITTDTSAMYKSNGSTDVGTATAPAAAPAVTPAPVAAPTTTIIRERTVYVDRTPKATHQKTVTTTAPTQPVTTTQSNTGAGITTTLSTNTGTGTNSQAGSTTTTTTTNQPAEKKGWSNAAKNAAIGGGVGAVGGAIISKKKGTGAIIGGVIGAAGGYILGRKKDKADTTR